MLSKKRAKMDDGREFLHPVNGERKISSSVGTRWKEETWLFINALTANSDGSILVPGRGGVLMGTFSGI